MYVMTDTHDLAALPAINTALAVSSSELSPATCPLGTDVAPTSEGGAPRATFDYQTRQFTCLAHDWTGFTVCPTCACEHAAMRLR